MSNWVNDVHLYFHSQRALLTDVRYGSKTKRRVRKKWRAQERKWERKAQRTWKDLALRPFRFVISVDSGDMVRYMQFENRKGLLAYGIAPREYWDRQMSIRKGLTEASKR